MNTLDRIIERLNAKYSSYAAFERDLGIKSKTVDSWLRGNSKAYLKKLPEISAVLDTTAAYLLGETDDPSPLDENQRTKREQGNARLYDALVKAGFMKYGEDLSDEQLAVISEYLSANKGFIHKIINEHKNES